MQSRLRHAAGFDGKGCGDDARFAAQRHGLDARIGAVHDRDAGLRPLSRCLP
jgi:hypothetical protein